MRKIIFAEEQHENNTFGLARLSCVVPDTWIPRIDEAWKHTRYNNRSEFIRAAILKEICEYERKLGESIISEKEGCK